MGAVKTGVQLSRETRKINKASSRSRGSAVRLVQQKIILPAKWPMRSLFMCLGMSKEKIWVSKVVYEKRNAAESVV